MTKKAKAQQQRQEDLSELLKRLENPDLEMIESFESIVKLEESKLEDLLKKLQSPDIDPACLENLPKLIKE